jgi:hypothetical protein
MPTIVEMENTTPIMGRTRPVSMFWGGVAGSLGGGVTKRGKSKDPSVTYLAIGHDVEEG